MGSVRYTLYWYQLGLDEVRVKCVEYERYIGAKWGLVNVLAWNALHWYQWGRN